MTTNPTVILVHGAFADASGYSGVVQRLRSEGVAARAPMNPLRGLAFDAEAVARYASIIEGPVRPVGHSYGGAVISQAVPAVKNVTGLVFLAAFAPDEGELRQCAGAVPTLAGRCRSRPLLPMTPPAAAGGPDLFINIPDFQQAFCADLPDDLAETMAVSQRPLSAAAISEKATVAGWKGLPSWYMVSEKDNAIPPTPSVLWPNGWTL